MKKKNLRKKNQLKNYIFNCLRGLDRILFYVFLKWSSSSFASFCSDKFLILSYHLVQHFWNYWNQSIWTTFVVYLNSSTRLEFYFNKIVKKSFMFVKSAANSPPWLFRRRRSNWNVSLQSLSIDLDSCFLQLTFQSWRPMVPNVF